MTHSLMRLTSHGGSVLYGADPMATHCRESGVPLKNVPGKVQKEFASKALQNKFHARRRERGSYLYDLLMNEAYGAAPLSIDGSLDDRRLLAHIVAKLEEWREDDIKEREGRPSWNTPPTG